MGWFLSVIAILTMDIKRCLEILELESVTSPEELKQAYRDMAKIWHPDRFQDNPRLQKIASTKLSEINEAYKTLLGYFDPELRKRLKRADSRYHEPLSGFKHRTHPEHQSAAQNGYFPDENYNTGRMNPDPPDSFKIYPAKKKSFFDLNRLLCHIILGVYLLAAVAEAQDNATDQMMIKAGYLLSAESNRLSILREKITEIRRKKIGSNPENDPELSQISMLITNLFWVETICSYESLLLSSLQDVAEGKKPEYYRKQYSRLKNVTLKKMYFNFKSTQSNFANIQDPEILALSGSVKKELLNVLKLIEEEIDLLEDRIQNEN